MIVVYDEHGGLFDHVPPFRVTTYAPDDNRWGDKSPFTTQSSFPIPDAGSSQQS